MDCIFCKIAKKEIPSKIVFENDRVLAFRDINPGAPVHVLVIPKKHISGIDASKDEDAGLLGELQCVARDIAKAEGVDKSGYRLVVNSGPDAGQAVAHIHLHLLGGRKFKWPPG